MSNDTQIDGGTIYSFGAAELYEERDRLRALLRRWVATVTLRHGDTVTYRMPGGDAALVGDTLKELGE